MRHRSARVGILAPLVALVAAAVVAASAEGRVYAGTAVVHEWYYDYCDFTSPDRRLYAEAEGVFPVTLSTGRPRVDSNGVREPNPLRFSFATDEQGGDGTFGLQSSYIATTPSQRDALLVYWSLRFNRRAGRIRGALVEDHREEAAATNVLFTALSGRPCDLLQPVQSFGDGEYGFTTSLRGRIWTRRARLVVAGSTWNGNRDVRITALLRRVR